ncbi:MAG: stalk-specific protein, partial [Caulobacter sp.]|nr:stalk-specific protein [Caulobacter sp.]
MGSGVPVAKKWLISAAYAASCAALLGLTGCGGSAPDDGYGGPGPSSYEESRAPGELMGGKAPPPADGLAGGPAVRGMAAIPNPENLPLEERRRIYGNKYDHLKYRPLPGSGDYAQSGGRGAGGKGSRAPGAPLRSYRNADGILVVHNAPIANPEDMSPAERRRVYGKRYAPRPQSGARRDWTVWKPKPKARPAPRVAAAPAYRPAPAPKAVAPKPAPKVAVAPAPKVAVKPAPAPVKVAPPVAVAKAAPAPAPVIKPAALPPVAKAPVAPAVDPKMAALSTAVSAEAIKGATLTVPDALAQGQEANVTLSLPVSLLDVIQKEAAKLGLTKAARKSDVSATLTGEGYTITPNAAQTQSLKKGEAATFNWQVKPGDGEKTPLKATVEGALKGQKGAPRTFSIATLEQVVANAVESGESQAKKLGFNLDKLAFPFIKPITIGDTVIPPGATTAGIIAFLIALILLAMARAGSGRRAREERRRKFRTMTDYGRAEPEAAPEPAHQPVNPMLAAAGGAAVGAGAAAMTFGAHEDDHGHAEASPEAHGHDAHGHDAHAADHHSDTAPMTFHSEDSHDAHADHGHAAPAHDDHGHDAQAPAADDDHAHAAPAAHDDHGHDAHA